MQNFDENILSLNSFKPQHTSVSNRSRPQICSHDSGVPTFLTCRIILELRYCFYQKQNYSDSRVKPG
jgi:hypothetical protein